MYKIYFKPPSHKSLNSNKNNKWLVAKEADVIMCRVITD